MRAPNAAAQELARLKWVKIPYEKRVEIMRKVRAGRPFNSKSRNKVTSP